jgi:hypothetical protein
MKTSPYRSSFLGIFAQELFVISRYHLHHQYTLASFENQANFLLEKATEFSTGETLFMLFCKRNPLSSSFCFAISRKLAYFPKKMINFFRKGECE